MIDITIDINEGELSDLAQRAEALIGPMCARGVDTGLAAGVAEARATHPYKDRTGALTASIGSRMLSSNNEGAEGVFEATARHASFIERGTDPHEIRPKNADALHWVDAGGEDVFAGAVQHPGTEALPFMKPAAETVKRVGSEAIGRDLTVSLAALLEGSG